VSALVAEPLRDLVRRSDFDPRPSRQRGDQLGTIDRTFPRS